MLRIKANKQTNKIVSHSENSVVIKIFIYFRWGMVIDGGIDGYSPLIVFLKIVDNNRARTVYETFMPATEYSGIPSRVRCNHRVENVDVVAFMIMYRCENRGSCITGKKCPQSVHRKTVVRPFSEMH